MPVFIQIPENPNCEAVDGQVFQCRSAERVVTHVRRDRGGASDWRPITGLAGGGMPCPATACLVEDSGEGMCYLIVGGEWGLRLKPQENPAPWGLDREDQWGESYLLVAGDGQELRFQH
jgi:hypothetical protein